MLKPVDEIYAQKLRSLRLQKDYLQKNLAKLLGLESQQDYSKLERGEKHFTEKIIEKICIVFKIELNDFINTKPQELSDKQSLELKLIKALEAEVFNDKINQLLSTKLFLEKEMKRNAEMIDEIKSRKYILFNQSKQGGVIISFY